MFCKIVFYFLMFFLNTSDKLYVNIPRIYSNLRYKYFFLIPLAIFGT